MRLLVSIDSWAAGLLFALAAAPLGCSSAIETAPWVPKPCESSAPVLVDGKPTGIEVCADGVIHRAKSLECPSLLPRAATCTGSHEPGPNSCTDDSSCTAQPNGSCIIGEPSGECACTYGCTTDADCTGGTICRCGDPVGVCVTATCAVDADCGGALCSQYTPNPGCPMVAFACQKEQDACAADSDCSGGYCSMVDGARSCGGLTCAVGRPFLVGGAPRLATATARRDWQASLGAPKIEGVSATDRAALADHWTRAALMEHASIAAFARFSLQLLAVGAPPDLLRDAQAAMVDETEHARLCFGLASTYGGREIGPDRLPLHGALDGITDEAILITTIREGCIGETVAALEAAEALEHAVDPAVRAVLAVIAEDERRHALLAWRYVAWALSSGDEALAAIVAAELGADAVEASASGSDELVSHGLLGGARRAEIRRQALEKAIRPCARALLGMEITSPPTRARARRDEGHASF